MAAGAAVPLLHDSVFRFTTLTGPERGAGAVGAVARVALVLAAVLALRAYDLVVRGSDRGVVDLHPVRAGAYVRARLVRAAREGLPALITASVVLVPVWPDGRAVIGGAAMLVGAWLAGIGLGVGVNLGAPGLGAEPRLAGVLDVIRGQNPRTQAALVWAPAATLAAAGLSIVAAAGGLDAALRGAPFGYAALLVPPAVAALGARLAFVGGNTLARIPAVLGEVDAAYAAVEEAEEGRRVYLDWMVPRLPAGLRPEALRVLRHGWRAERSWVNASFFAAALAGAAGWTESPEGATRVVTAAGLAAVGIGLLGPRLVAKDPPWLALTLPGQGRRKALAIVLFAWIQPVVAVGVLVLLVRQGAPAAGALLRLEAMSAAVSAIGAWLPARGYVPAALLVWAAGVWA